jgi:hypothetical protein
MLAATLVCLLGLAMPATAQNLTTGTLSGVVTDEQGAVLPGVDIVATHVPTGTVYNTVSQGDGSFTMQAVRVGGPYSVIAKMGGFKEQTLENVTVSLGEARAVSFKMSIAGLSEAVEVTATANPIFSATRTGTASNVSSETIKNLPTISRSIEDYARLSPHFTPTASNDGAASPVSVAGKNPRYNNFQIDGAANSDLFGLSDSAAPGGPAGTQPVSLDAIQEIQLVVAPYDVRQGMFSGGGINAVTKSGTNDIHADGYYFFQNQDLVKDDPTGRKIAPFKSQAGGFSLGGPVLRNKAFFFTNVDITRKERPSGWSADGSSGQSAPFTAEIARVKQVLQDRYGYNPGGLGEFVRPTPSNKWFIRGDANLGGRHQLTIRNNYIDASDAILTQSNTRWVFPDFIYTFADQQNATVGQLNSTFGSLFNEARVNYTRIRDHRETPTQFPSLTIHAGAGGTSRIFAGPDNFSGANRLDQDIIEVTDDVTMVKGKHTLTLGTHNEFYKFENLFIRDFYGTYEFVDIDHLAAGQAQGFDYSFSVTGNANQAAKFGVNQFGFYAGDQWRVSNNFTMQYGVRVDVPNFPDHPTQNPASEAAFGYSTTTVPGKAMWSPRVGFNWNLPGELRQQVRGGVGIFSGRTPYVWLSNQYGNTGIEFTRLRVFYAATTNVPFVSDPNSQPKAVPGGSAATNEIDLIDPDYQFPSSLRWNLAYDRDLGFLGLVATGEVVFSETLKEIDYRNLNFVPSGVTRPDGRPVMARAVPTLSDAIFLTNTDKGRQWSASGQLQRPFKNGLYLSGAYIYGSSTSVNDGGSSQAASNWGNTYAVNSNAVDVATSNFEVRHRVTIGGSYLFKLPAGLTATTAVYYNGQIGRPYVAMFGNDVNADTRTGNDLLYVPNGPDDVIIRNGTWADLDAFISADNSLKNYRGKIAPRNAGNTPWTNNVDFHLSLGVPTKRIKSEVVLDVLNLGNLLNKDWGLVQYTIFNQIFPLTFAGIDAPTGKYIYDIATLTRTDTNGNRTYQKFSRDDFRSRAQAQLSFRVRF